VQFKIMLPRVSSSLIDVSFYVFIFFTLKPLTKPPLVNVNISNLRKHVYLKTSLALEIKHLKMDSTSCK